MSGSLRSELAALLALAETAWPITTQHLQDHLAPRAQAITRSNEQLAHPPWAHRVGSRDDVFIELRGDIAGVRLPVASRGGAYAELSIARGSLADVEAVAGPLTATPKVHFDSPARAIAYPTVGGHRLRVLTELDPRGQLRLVSVHYEQ
jgi:hypothetical protein